MRSHLLAYPALLCLLLACSDEEAVGASAAGSAGQAGSAASGSSGASGASSGAAGVAGQGGAGAGGAGAGGVGGAGAGGAGAAGAPGGAGGESGQGGQAGCPVLALSQTKIFRESIARFGIEARVSPGVEGQARSAAIFELYEDDGSGELPPLKVGTFDLSKAPDNDYGTCQHCVLVVGYDASGQAKRLFFQKSGTVTVDKLDPEDQTVAAGSIADVSLVELRQNPDLSWEELPGGGCFQLPSWSFDTTPVNGGPCERAEDCPNTAQQVCDPASRTCATFQCLFTGDLLCPGDQICRSQIGDESSIGACYDTCSPSDPDGCGAGAQCLPLGPVQEIGACRPTGPAAAGAPCDESDVTTGCEAGFLCAGQPARCEAVCDYLTASPGCPEGRVCGVENTCLPPSSGDPAAIGATCQPGAAFQGDCGADGEAFRGLCLNLFPEDTALTCYRTCRTLDPECPSGESCLGLFSNPTVGLCWPDPVCGDGVIDPVPGEVCDDGNAVDGDGCSADCKTPEFEPLCAVAAPLTLDQDITGTTAGGPTGYGGSCETYIVVPTRTFSFTPPGPGTLKLELTSTKNLDLLVVGDCADPGGSELGCRSIDDAGERLSIDFDAAPAKPVLVAVRGEAIADVGDFTLRATYVDAVCGDGQIAGPEVCDDGNTTGGDGCAAGCQAIEWPELCASLPVLSTTAPNVGDTTGGQNLINTDSFCTSVFGSGPEAIFRYTAPSAGTLSLALPEPTVNLALYVLKGCGAPGDNSNLSCSNGGFPPAGGEQLSVELAAGEDVLVVVDGFLPDVAAPFSLTASFE